MQAIPPGFHHRPKGVAVVTDIDGGEKTDIDLPSPTKAGIAKDADGKPIENGDAAKEEEFDWSKTGWAPRFGWPSTPAHEGESMLDHTTWLEGQLSEQWFGGTFPVIMGVS